MTPYVVIPQEEVERQHEAEQRQLSALEEQTIKELVEDFPRVWKDPRTSDRDRKRMVRLLLEDDTDAGVAEQLNHRGWRTFAGKPFDARRVLSLRRDHQLKDHGTRLRERGLLTADEAASAYGVCRQTIMGWWSSRHPMSTHLRSMLTNLKQYPHRTKGVQYATKSFCWGW